MSLFKYIRALRAWLHTRKLRRSERRFKSGYSTASHLLRSSKVTSEGLYAMTEESAAFGDFDQFDAGIRAAIEDFHTEPPKAPRPPLPARRNYDPTNNKAYGVISAQVLTGEVVDTLLFGHQATNQTYEAEKAAYLATIRVAATLAGDEFGELDHEEAVLDFAEQYTSDCDIVTGVHQGVTYESVWFGGALHFIITRSPHIRGAGLASPCVPGAGDLHLDGTLSTYDVSPAWRI